MESLKHINTQDPGIIKMIVDYAIFAVIGAVAYFYKLLIGKADAKDLEKKADKDKVEAMEKQLKASVSHADFVELNQTIKDLTKMVHDMNAESLRNFVYRKEYRHDMDLFRQSIKDLKDTFSSENAKLGDKLDNFVNQLNQKADR